MLDANSFIQVCPRVTVSISYDDNYYTTGIYTT